MNIDKLLDSVGRATPPDYLLFAESEPLGLRPCRPKLLGLKSFNLQKI
jgi:hypothetical protein